MAVSSNLIMSQCRGSLLPWAAEVRFVSDMYTELISGGEEYSVHSQQVCDPMFQGCVIHNIVVYYYEQKWKYLFQFSIQNFHVFPLWSSSLIGLTVTHCNYKSTAA
jgi:hypothetical protein